MNNHSIQNADQIKYAHKKKKKSRVAPTVLSEEDDGEGAEGAGVGAKSPFFCIALIANADLG